MSDNNNNIEKNDILTETNTESKTAFEVSNRLFCSLVSLIGISLMIAAGSFFCCLYCSTQIEELQSAVGIDENKNNIESETETTTETETTENQIPEPNLYNGKLLDTLTYSDLCFDDVTTNIYSYISLGTPYIVICNSLGMRQEFGGFAYMSEASHNEDGTIYLKDTYSNEGFISITISDYHFSDDVPYFKVYYYKIQ